MAEEGLNRSFFRIHRALFGIYMALFRIDRALFGICRALFGVYRALFGICGEFLRVYRAIFGNFDGGGGGAGCADALAVPHCSTPPPCNPLGVSLRANREREEGMVLTL